MMNHSKLEISVTFKQCEDAKQDFLGFFYCFVGVFSPFSLLTQQDITEYSLGFFYHEENILKKSI